MDPDPLDNWEIQPSGWMRRKQPDKPRKRKSLWPRGKYNGHKIVGFELKLRLIVTMWQWLPRYYRYPNALVWGCFIVNFGFEYEYER